MVQKLNIPKIPCDQLDYQYLDGRHFHMLIDQDTDLNDVMVYRKAYFTADELTVAFDALKGAASEWVNENDVDSWSGRAGWLEPNRGIMESHLSKWTANNLASWEKSFPFIQKMDAAAKELMPQHHVKNVEAAADLTKLDSRFVVPGTNFTSVVVNRNFRTRGHKDDCAHDGVTGMTVISPNTYTGGELILPEYGIALVMLPGDLVLFNMDLMHANMPINATPERYSAVVHVRGRLIPERNAP